MTKIRAIFFDLDGTLAPLDESKFIELYMSALAKKAMSYGYDGKAFLKAIGEGTMLMFNNDGKKSNEDIFWECVLKKFPTLNKNMFDDFYENDFKEVLVSVGQNDLAKPIVDYCNEHFDYVVLSTNPLFPFVATKQRMEKVNLKEEDFDFITSYENSAFCKPNPAYFRFLLEKFNLKPEEVIVLGNNDYEDCWCASEANIKTLLIGDNLIHDKRNTKKFEHLKMDEVIDFLKNVNV